MLALLAAMLVMTAQDTIRLSLTDAMTMAREKNTDFLRSQLNRDNATLNLAAARARRYYPTLNMNFTVPTYTSSLSSTAVVVSGVEELRVSKKERRTVASNLDLFQPLPSGGTLQITGSVTAVQQPLSTEDHRFVGQTQVGITLSQQLFGVNFSIRQYRLQQEQFARSEAQFIDQERNIARSLLTNYFDLVKALKQAQIDSVIALRDSARSATTPARATATTTSVVDSLRLELEASRSAYNRTRSKQALQRAQANLNEALSLAPGTVVVPDAAINVEPFVPNVGQGLAYAKENRYDVRLAQLSVDNNTTALDDAHRTSPVTLSVNSTLGFNGSQEEAQIGSALNGAFGRQNRSKDVTLRVSIPLYDRHEEGNSVARAQNSLAISELNLADQERQLVNEIQIAADRVTNSVTQLALARQQSDITTRTLDIQTGRYAAGEVNSVEFLIDQTNARTAEIALIDAQVGLLTALEDWRRAIGERSLIAGADPTRRSAP